MYSKLAAKPERFQQQYRDTCIATANELLASVKHFQLEMELLQKIVNHLRSESIPFDALRNDIQALIDAVAIPLNCEKTCKH